jgi:hypothetical protein
MASDELKRELLMLEYKVAHDGHKSRDELIPREFAYMLQAFVIFVTLVGAAKAFLTFDRAFAIVVFILIGLAGMICLLAFLTDIQANTSCKLALRSRAAKIEKELGAEYLQYWETIRNRGMFFEEALFKGTTRDPLMQSVAVGFVWAGRLLVLLWVIAIILIIVWGEAMKIG